MRTGGGVGAGDTAQCRLSLGFPGVALRGSIFGLSVALELEERVTVLNEHRSIHPSEVLGRHHRHIQRFFLLCTPRPKGPSVRRRWYKLSLCRNSRSRVSTTVVNLCALVEGDPVVPSLLTASKPPSFASATAVRCLFSVLVCRNRPNKITLPAQFLFSSFRTSRSGVHKEPYTTLYHLRLDYHCCETLSSRHKPQSRNRYHTSA